MKEKRLIIAAFFSLLLFSCGADRFTVKIDNKEFALVEEMSMQEVKNILGSDFEVQQNKALGFENWIYPSIENEQVKVIFKDNKLIGVSNKE